jgi:hypothetical protein
MNGEMIKQDMRRWHWRIEAAIWVLATTEQETDEADERMRRICSGPGSARGRARKELMWNGPAW